MTIRSREPRGFTLVELLVVIAIIGILVGLLLPAVQSARVPSHHATWYSELWPFLEEAAIGSAWDPVKSYPFQPQSNMEVQIATYECPARPDPLLRVSGGQRGAVAHRPRMGLDGAEGDAYNCMETVHTHGVLSVAFEIHIATGASVPLYRQIVDRVRQLRASGRLEAGTELPSVRGLAEQLVINPSTVARAYQQLLIDGVIESRPGRGYFVIEARSVLSDEERQRRLAESVSQLVKEATFLEFSSADVVSAVQRGMRDYLDPNKGRRKS